ncbi:hypothetical protein SODALDRAFT_322546 [Sodiomyces alkalinus F11]|uniref:Uncharacterized protein n=1 Tax=Sodiomyces alkalinus (strain CBS 110278 / VKM F-3762 / F11) TaxID=1314773 RepID=A0A3N2Q3T3_SODAK|nr:hypothetical protein SODALDRAFT_322546 [Sodiomyces alkalinus F11]ROT41412.1 hypothetical protein SODALDRAFT_322546 [Sodiomyces alkalinus F11]
MDGLNHRRTVRVADVLSDFRTLQYHIAAAPTEPLNVEDYYTEGWAALRQCAIDGHHILECAADTRVPEADGEAEQEKAELKQILLDSYARRHEAQKIYLRQAAAQRWIENREAILQGGRPHTGNRSLLRACDQQLRAELSMITDEVVYHELQISDQTMGRWTDEDPSLRSVQRWLRARRR